MAATIPTVKTQEEPLVKKAEPRAKAKKQFDDSLFSITREPMEQARYAAASEERNVFGDLEKYQAVQ